MDERIERAQRFADIHAQSRYEAGKSQEYMAMGLGVSKKTIQNWEKGISSPTFFQSLEWFRLLGINPYPYYYALIYPEQFEHISGNDDDLKIEQALEALLKKAPMKWKRALLYLFYGSHGSSPNSVIQLMLAHLHLPMHSRVGQAGLILQNYEMAELMGELVQPDNILPDIEVLRESIQKGKNAVVSGQKGYLYPKLNTEEYE